MALIKKIYTLKRISGTLTKTYSEHANSEFNIWQQKEELVSGWRTTHARGDSLLSSDVLMRRHKREKQSFFSTNTSRSGKQKVMWACCFSSQSMGVTSVEPWNVNNILFSKCLKVSHVILLIFALQKDTVRIMETFSINFLALIRRRDSICSITGKNCQELAIKWKLWNKNNCDRS